MSHQVQPIALRAGKTQLWSNNVVTSNTAPSGGSLTLGAGLYSLASKLLKRKRLYIVRGGIRGYKHGRLRYSLIFIPRIKSKPRQHRVGAFVRRSIYRSIDWSTQQENAIAYVDRRIDKRAKLPKRRRVHLNRWLRKRLLRGANKLKYRKHRLAVPRISRKPVRRLRLAYSTALPTMPPIKRFKRRHHLRVVNAHKFYKRYFKYMRKYGRWKFDKVKSRRFNSRAFSKRLAFRARMQIKVAAINMFSYLISKAMISYKSHQNHFWHHKYRRFRFKYKNYFDIVNAFFAMGVMENTESYLMSILKITLPLILKIKRFFKFLDIVIKHLRGIRVKFSVFKVIVAGKLAGGTKRTKLHSIGFGTLPSQTLTLAAKNILLCYTHIYGEFGVRFIMCKSQQKLEHI